MPKTHRHTPMKHPAKPLSDGSQAAYRHSLSKERRCLRFPSHRRQGGTCSRYTLSTAHERHLGHTRLVQSARGMCTPARLNELSFLSAIRPWFTPIGTRPLERVPSRPLRNDNIHTQSMGKGRHIIDIVAVHHGKVVSERQLLFVEIPLIIYLEDDLPVAVV